MNTTTPLLASSPRLFYAVEAVLLIALNEEKGSVSSVLLAGLQKREHRYLEQTMQKLVHKGVLISVRGPKGGYRLADSWKHKTIAHIVEVLADEGTEAPETHTEIGRTVVAPLWEEMRMHALSQLRKVKISDLCRQAVEAA